MAMSLNLDALLERYRRSKEIVESNYKAWHEFHNYYVSKKTAIYNEYKEKRILPIAFSTIMSILPRIMALRPEVHYVMRKYPEIIDSKIDQIEQGVDIQMEKEDLVSLMDYIIQWQWDKAHGDVYLQKLLLHSLIYGTGIMRVGWNEEENRPDFDAIEPFYFFPNPEATSPFNMEWCIVRNFISKNKFKEIYGVEAKDTYMSDEISDAKDTNDVFDRVSRGGDMVEVFEYFDKKQIIHFTKDKILKKYDNIIGKIPIIVNYNYIPVNNFWGMSEIDQIEEFIKDMTDFRANRHTNIDLISNVMWRVDPNKEVILGDVVSAPGQMVRAEEGALEILQMPPLPKDTYQEDMILKNDVREVSGISDYLRGGTPQRFETATAIENLVQSGNARINMRVINLVEFFIKPLGELLIEFNKKFLKPLVITVPTGGVERQIKIDVGELKALDTDYDLRIIPNNMDKTRKEEFIQFLQIMSQSPQMSQYVDFQALVETMFKMWNIPTYKLIKSKQDIMQEQAMAMNQAQVPQEQAQGQPQGQSMPQGQGGNPQEQMALIQQLMGGVNAQQK